MPRIRSFIHDDIAKVADLHRRVFNVRDESGHDGLSERLSKSYSEYFTEVFLGNPWKDSALSSLVYEDDKGNIAGFLGVMPRQMEMDARPVTVALSSQFVVDPESRSSGVGIRLLQAFLAGPQDLSLTDEANHTSRRLWEALGGSTALVYSLNWTRLLRPAEHALSQIQQRYSVRPLIAMARPVTRILDRVLTDRFPQRFKLVQSDLSEKALSTDAYLDNRGILMKDRKLIPTYDNRTFQWVVNRLRLNRDLGQLRQVALHRQDGDLAGCYLYFLKPGSKSSLIQLLARRNMESQVFDHLFYDAWIQGSNAISGKLDPQYSLILSEKRCQFSCGSPWTLIHSQNRDLLRLLQAGEALLSGLEGEMCIRFVP